MDWKVLEQNREAGEEDMAQIRAMAVEMEIGLRCCRSVRGRSGDFCRVIPGADVARVLPRLAWNWLHLLLFHFCLNPWWEALQPAEAQARRQPGPTFGAGGGVTGGLGDARIVFCKGPFPPPVGAPVAPTSLPPSLSPGAEPGSRGPGLTRQEADSPRALLAGLLRGFLPGSGLGVREPSLERTSAPAPPTAVRLPLLPPGPPSSSTSQGSLLRRKTLSSLPHGWSSDPAMPSLPALKGSLTAGDFSAPDTPGDLAGATSCTPWRACSAPTPACPAPTPGPPPNPAPPCPVLSSPALCN
ncbi:hypothetical protein H8959_004169 [Pygathrix nigripes]